VCKACNAPYVRARVACCMRAHCMLSAHAYTFALCTCTSLVQQARAHACMGHHAHAVQLQPKARMCVRRATRLTCAHALRAACVRTACSVRMHTHAHYARAHCLGHHAHAVQLQPKARMCIHTMHVWMSVQGPQVHASLCTGPNIDMHTCIHCKNAHMHMPTHIYCTPSTRALTHTLYMHAQIIRWNVCTWGAAYGHAHVPTIIPIGLSTGLRKATTVITADGSNAGVTGWCMFPSVHACTASVLLMSVLALHSRDMTVVLVGFQP
jgi:hypothetical protein